MKLATAFNNLDFHSRHHGSELTEVETETETERHEGARASHRAKADLPTLWRVVRCRTDLEDYTPEKAAALIRLQGDAVTRIDNATRAFLREKVRHFGLESDDLDDAVEDARRRPSHAQTSDNQGRIQVALIGER